MPLSADADPHTRVTASARAAHTPGLHHCTFRIEHEQHAHDGPPERDSVPSIISMRYVLKNISGEYKQHHDVRRRRTWSGCSREIFHRDQLI